MLPGESDFQPWTIRERAIIAANRAIYGDPNPPLDHEQRRAVERIVDAVLNAVADGKK